jgi:hypothetical protein
MSTYYSDCPGCYPHFQYNQLAHVGDYGCLNERQQRVRVDELEGLEKDITECTIECKKLADARLGLAVTCARLEEELATAVAEHDKTEKRYNICSNERDRMIKECIDERKRMAYERCCERDRMYNERDRMNDEQRYDEEEEEEEEEEEDVTGESNIRSLDFGEECEDGEDEEEDEEEGEDEEEEGEGDVEDEEGEGEDEEKEKEEKNEYDKCIAEPLFCLPIGFTLPECAICFDEIQMVNVTVTTCGHAFHSSCVFKALGRSDGCPLCRNQLIASLESEADSDSEDGSEEDEEEEEIFKVDLEQLATKMTNMGYTISDLLKLYVPSIKTTSEKYTDAFVYKIGTDIDDVLDGIISLVHRDMRSYAAVTKT